MCAKSFAAQSISIKRRVLSNTKQAVTDTDAWLSQPQLSRELFLYICSSFGLKARSSIPVCKINHKMLSGA